MELSKIEPNNSKLSKFFQGENFFLEQRIDA